MLKQRVKYVDFNGIEKERDLYFNMTKSDFLALELNTPNGFGAALQDAVENGDTSSLITHITNLVGSAYGIKSADGTRFSKSPEELKAFKDSPEYDAFLFELLTNAEKCAAFFNGLVPEDLKKQVEEMASRDGFRPGASDVRPGQARLDSAAAPDVNVDEPDVAGPGSLDVTNRPVRTFEEPKNED